MVRVNFYITAKDSLLGFAVIVARYRGKWVFCRHRERATLECPGGHREPGEAILDTAKRELYEETGALRYKLEPVCVYAVEGGGEETFGMLYYANILELGQLPDAFEMERVELLEGAPERWTYPEIQPKLLERVARYLEQ